MTEDDSATPWYADGLRFGCTRCGACCSGGGVVEVTDAEIARLSAFLALEDAAFRSEYTRPLRRGGVALVEGDHGECVFLDLEPRSERRRCSVHGARPGQCRSYPFWAATLESAAHWKDEATRCPGIGQGPLRAWGEIREALRVEADPDGDTPS